VSIRFLADEDINAHIVQGLRTREPAIDILDVKTGGLRGMQDPDLLELAAHQDRILITCDRHTMTQYFRDRLDAGKPGTALFVLPQAPSAVGEIVESLLLIWTASQAEEWRNRIVYLPFR
jgi:uncharacterized protein DUF5615